MAEPWEFDAVTLTMKAPAWMSILGMVTFTDLGSTLENTSEPCLRDDPLTSLMGTV